MVLEDVLHRSYELTRYRRPPIGPEMDGFCHWLHAQGYSHSVIRTYIAKVSRFNQYLRYLGIKNSQDVHDLHADRFIATHLRRRERISSPHTAPAVRSVMKYLTDRGIVIPAVEAPLPYQSVLDGYLDYLRRDRCLADTTIRIYRHYLMPFLQCLDGTDILRSLSEISPQEVHVFFVKHARGKADTTRGQIQATLRSFFTFCARQSYVPVHLPHSVPKVFRYRLANLPRLVSEEDVQKVMLSIDRSTSAGRRDYAIVQLLHTYGVRGVQVRALRLQDIQWRHSRIRFRSCKSGKEILDPLTDAVGESLLDYLRHGRPKAAYPEVFLTDHAPFHPLKADTLYLMIASRMRRLGLSQAALGPHAFRHGFATRMLNSGQPLKTIADMLGHRSIDSTFIYAKVDFETLTQLPLDWPEV